MNGKVVTVAPHSVLVSVFMGVGAGDPELMKRVAALRAKGIMATFHPEMYAGSCS